MIYNDAVQQALDQSYANTKDAQVTIVKLATVKQVIDGQGAKVQFYGETSQSTKIYPYIDGYLPEVNDKVALLPQANTYIILGKVTTEAPEQKWAEVDHNHDGVYLPVAYANKLSDDTKTIELSAAGLLPNSNKVINLGTSSYQYKAGYFQTLYLNGTEFNPSDYALSDHNHDDLYLPLEYAAKMVNGTREIDLYVPSSGVPSLQPNTTGAIDIGSTSRQFRNAYVNKLFLNGTEFDPESVTPDKLQATSGATTRDITLKVTSSSKANLVPSLNNGIALGDASHYFMSAYITLLSGTWMHNVDTSQYNLGWASDTQLSPNVTNRVSIGTSSKELKNLYAQNVYNNGTAVTSDKRKKKGIKGLIKKYVSLFWKLRPVSYKYKDGDSGRTHTGYIAQEVEQAALDSGLTLEDLAAVVIDDQGNYSLRYNELIAIQHAAILELKERIDKMETELNRLKNKEV